MNEEREDRELGPETTRCMACGGELVACEGVFPVRVEDRVFFEPLAAWACAGCTLTFSDPAALEAAETLFEHLLPMLCTYRQKMEGLKVVEDGVTTMDEPLLIRECQAQREHADAHLCGPWYDPADPTRAVALNRVASSHEGRRPAWRVPR